MNILPLMYKIGKEYHENTCTGLFKKKKTLSRLQITVFVLADHLTFLTMDDHDTIMNIPMSLRTTSTLSCNRVIENLKGGLIFETKIINFNKYKNQISN